MGRRELSAASVDAVRLVLRVDICELLRCDDCRSLRVAGVDAGRLRAPAPRRGSLAAIDLEAGDGL